MRFIMALDAARRLPISGPYRWPSARSSLTTAIR